MIALRNRIQERLVSAHNRNLALQDIFSFVNDGELGASVVIPTRNRASYLSYTLSSLERQSFPRSAWELIVVDRESQDETQGIVKQFMRRKALQVRYHHCSRSQTIGSAFNEGISLSKGKIIVLLSESQIVSEDFLLHHLTNHTSINALVSRLNKFAVYTHLFYPSDDHIEGVQSLPILPPRKMRSIEPLRHMVVEEQRPAALDTVPEFPTEDRKPWTMFDSSNASFPKVLHESVCFDDCFLTKEIADIDFAYRASSSGFKLVLEADDSSYRQLTPTVRHNLIDLEVDMSRSRRKFYLEYSAKAAKANSW